MNCLKCNQRIPTRLVIDGRERNLQRRKYCLTCSPFGTHNTKNLIKGSNIPKICKICNKKYTNKGTQCSTCRITTWRRNKKKLLVEYKGGKCKLCGYNRCNENLTFYHRNPSEKDFQISGTTLSFETIKKEVDKCELLCRNCHGEVHAGLVSIPE